MNIEFQKLFEQIHSCKKCKSVTSEKVLRKSEKVNFQAKVMIISEAMAPSQVRLSGVNFFDVSGNIGNTGKMLEKFLNKIGLTIYPGKSNTVYNTEIVHCFPGYSPPDKEKQSIRRPSGPEIHCCIEQGFIHKEIELLSPKIIFLMGKTSYETFYEKFLGSKPGFGLTEKIESIKNSRVFDTYQNIPIIPIQHASGANPRYSTMLNDSRYINLIREVFLRQIFSDIWTRETSYSPETWTSDCPSYGHCAVTSLIVQDIFGGDIRNAKAVLPNGLAISHYYNFIDGSDVDCTRDQFPAGVHFTEGIEKKGGFQTTRDFILSNKHTCERYLCLKERYLRSGGMFIELKNK